MFLLVPLYISLFIYAWLLVIVYLETHYVFVQCFFRAMFILFDHRLDSSVWEDYVLFIVRSWSAIWWSCKPFQHNDYRVARMESSLSVPWPHWLRVLSTGYPLLWWARQRPFWHLSLSSGPSQIIWFHGRIRPKLSKRGWHRLWLVEQESQNQKTVRQ